MTLLSTVQTSPGGVLVDAVNRTDRRNVTSRPATVAYLGQVREILEGLRPWWPVTLRQTYYGLVGKGLIPNNRKAYQKLSAVLTTARIQGDVPWEAIEDRNRERLSAQGWPDAGEFVKDQLDDFLVGYRRDLLQSQPVALELVVEKDALSRICYQAAEPYGVSVLVGRGNSSVSQSNEFCARARDRMEEGRKTRILYFGDLDPSGVAMLPSVLFTMQVEMGLGDAVEGYYVALQPWHVTAYDLPQDPAAIKSKDSRTPAYVERYGNLAVELDALPPRVLQGLVRGAIEAHLDMDLFHGEQVKAGDERLRIGTLQERAEEFLRGDREGEGEDESHAE